MSVRIKDLATTATSPANDDYIAIDGATNGTRKIPASEIGGGGTSDDITNESTVSGATVTAALSSLNDQIANKGTYSKPSGGIPKSDLASAVQTSLEKADTALQTAPVTSVNGMTGAVTGLQTTANLVTSLSASSTNTEYPSAKAVYDIIGDVETLLASI